MHNARSSYWPSAPDLGALCSLWPHAPPRPPSFLLFLLGGQKNRIFMQMFCDEGSYNLEPHLHYDPETMWPSPRTRERLWLWWGWFGGWGDELCPAWRTGGLLLFLFSWMEVKCALNLETPPFVSSALLTQAVKLGAGSLGGDWMGPLWEGGAHPDAIEGEEMPLRS